MIRRSWFCWLLLALGAAACAADPNAGRKVFQQQCALCHSAEPDDGGGAQGPDLHGLFERHAAADGDYPYTQALRDSKLTWDAATLDRFLAAPMTVVPGTAMGIVVSKAEDREALIAYFESLKSGKFKAEADKPNQMPQDTPRPKGESEWKQDRPGRVHHIEASKLPKPFATPSARNIPRQVKRPANLKPVVPAGFKVDVFTTEVKTPRTLLRAPNGDIFVAETRQGRIKVLRPSADGTRPQTIETFAQGLHRPFGMRFYPAGDTPEWLYVAEVNRVVRYAYKPGAPKAVSVPEVVIAQLAPAGTTGHSTRDLAFSLDGKRMFVSVGSESNFAERMPKKSVAQAQAWDAQHGIAGAAWDSEENRAAVLMFEVGSDQTGKIFATGIRNCVGLTMHPATGELWCTTNERDGLGDDLVPDYSTRVKEGGFYGWPWYYLGNHEDPRLKGERPDLAGTVIVPDVLYQAHSAALNLTFYSLPSGATPGGSAFPREYVGDGFAVFHGSWNRAFRTGHKVVRVRMKNGVPTGKYEDFMTGLIGPDDAPWGRPVAAAVAQDGSLLISDDGADLIYRISYSAK